MSQEYNELRSRVVDAVQALTMETTTSVRIVVMSHLSDIGVEAMFADQECTSERRHDLLERVENRVEFIKYLISKYQDFSTHIYPDAEYQAYRTSKGK